MSPPTPPPRGGLGFSLGRHFLGRSSNPHVRSLSHIAAGLRYAQTQALAVTGIAGFLGGEDSDNYTPPLTHRSNPSSPLRCRASFHGTGGLTRDNISCWCSAQVILCAQNSTANIHLYYRQLGLEGAHGDQ